MHAFSERKERMRGARSIGKGPRPGLASQRNRPDTPRSLRLRLRGRFPELMPPNVLAGDMVRDGSGTSRRRSPEGLRRACDRRPSQFLTGGVKTMESGNRKHRYSYSSGVKAVEKSKWGHETAVQRYGALRTPDTRPPEGQC